MPIHAEEDCAVGAIYSVLERRREPGWNFGHNPGRPNAGLVLILEGQMRLEQGGTRTSHGPDSVIYLRKGLCYQIAVEGTGMLHFLVVNFELLLGGFPLEPDNAVALAGESARRARSWCVQMAACFETQEPLHRLRARALFQQVLYEIAHARSRNHAPDHPRVEAALNYLRRYYGAEIGVPDVARHAGVSRRALELRFRKALNVTVLEALQRTRLKRVCVLLAESNQSVTAIAAACGFSSKSYLGKVFRRTYRTTMTAYRAGR